MAKRGSTFTGPSIASLRGGSIPSGVKSVVFSIISKEGLVSSPIQNFSNKRGEDFSNFLRQVKGNDGGSTPLFPFRPLSVNQIEAVRDSRVNISNIEAPIQPQAPVVSRNKPLVIWFGSPIRNAIPEIGDFGQPQIVEKSVSFALLVVEQVKVEPVVNDSVSSINEAKVGVVQEAVTSQPEVKSVERGYEDQLLPRRPLSVVEQVGIAMMVKAARVSLLKPRSQAIAMAGVESEVAALPMAATVPAPSGQSSIDRASDSEVKVELPKKVSQVRRKTRVLQQARKDFSPEKRRTRFVERDLEMNAWRLKALVKGYLELADQGEVDGAALAAHSHIGSSKELRSVFLDQRGYRDRPDGSLRRMELFLGSVRVVNKGELKVIVNEHTAVRETYEEPRDKATIREVNEVVNEPKNLDTRFEPVEIEEIVEQGKVTEAQVFESRKVEQTPQIIDEKPLHEVDFDQEREIQAVSTDSSMRSVDIIGHNVNQILGLARMPLERRSLVYAGN